MNFIDANKLLRVLRENHTSFMDSTQLYRRALVDARDSHYRTAVPGDASVCVKPRVIVSKFDAGINGSLEIWVEFSIQRADGTVVGTHVYEVSLDGACRLAETRGVVFPNDPDS